MNKRLLKIMPKIVSTLRKHQVRKAGVFGSYARNDLRANSDIDILIEFTGKKSLIDLVGLKLDLEKSLKKKVDVLTYKSIHPLIKKQILKDEVKIL